MPPINGTSVLLKIRTSTGPTVYTTLGSQRGVTIERTAAEIDTSSKDGADWTGLPGRRESTISLDALYVPSDTAKAALVTAYESGALCNVQRTAAGADPARSADCIITTLHEEYPDQDAAVFTVDLKVSGAWA